MVIRLWKWSKAIRRSFGHVDGAGSIAGAISGQVKAALSRIAARVKGSVNFSDNALPVDGRTARSRSQGVQQVEKQVQPLQVILPPAKARVGGNLQGVFCSSMSPA
jgi:hypothetical protein